MRIIGELLRDYGDLVRVWIGPSLMAINKNPKDIEVTNNITIKGVTLTYNFTKLNSLLFLYVTFRAFLIRRQPCMYVICC